MPSSIDPNRHGIGSSAGCPSPAGRPKSIEPIYSWPYGCHAYVSYQFFQLPIVAKGVVGVVVSDPYGLKPRVDLPGLAPRLSTFVRVMRSRACVRVCMAVRPTRKAHNGVNLGMLLPGARCHTPVLMFFPKFPQLSLNGDHKTRNEQKKRGKGSPGKGRRWKRSGDHVPLALFSKSGIGWGAMSGALLWLGETGPGIIQAKWAPGCEGGNKLYRAVLAGLTGSMAIRACKMIP